MSEPILPAGNEPAEHDHSESTPDSNDAVNTGDNSVCENKSSADKPDNPTTNANGDRDDADDERKYVIVRHGLMRQIGQFRHDLSRVPPAGSKLVVRTERGVEIGEVVIGVASEGCQRCISTERLTQYVKANGPEYPFRKGGAVLRVANSQDIIDARHLEQSARDEAKLCRQMIRSSKLPMRLVTVEHLLGGERIIFYFTAETRVDFRDLVRTLASEFRTRIEMRQVGARDEARIIGDFERCGRQCCCQAYLKDLRPVSMRMAKTQKATLDPSKISGRCGRLMCCLRYEDVCYEELRRLLPRKNTWVRTDQDKVGRVIDSQIITQLVRLVLPDNSHLVVPNEEIVERDVEAPVLPKPGAPRPPKPPRKRPTKPLRDEVVNVAQAPDGGESSQGQDTTPDSQPQGTEQDGADRRRRRRRPRKRNTQGQAQAQGNAQAGQQGASGDGSSKREGKRRKRRKGKNRNAGASSAAGAQSGAKDSKS